VSQLRGAIQSVTASSACLASFIYKQPWSRGSVGIPKGFPRPVQAVLSARIRQGIILGATCLQDRGKISFLKEQQ
jgi:hypothetical protein